MLLASAVRATGTTEDHGGGGAAVNSNPQAEAGPRQKEDELARLVGRAERGDLTVLPALREALAANPTLWQT